MFLLNFTLLGVVIGIKQSCYYIFSKKLAPIFEELGGKMKDNKNILIANLDWTANPIPGIQVQGYPTVKFFKRNGQVVDYDGDRSLNDMARFLKDHTTFEWIDIGLPKDEGPDPHQMDGVFTVTKENFHEEVTDSDKDVLLELYAPWCGHCKKLQPIYAKLNQKLRSNPNIRILKVDKTKHDVPVKTEGFPTVMFFRKGSPHKTITYEGDRSLKSFLSFLKENTSFTWIEP